MNAVGLARFLGWFSIALGAVELAIPGALSRRLGLVGGPGLVRAFGLRELAAGGMVLARPSHMAGSAFRVIGDAMDIAVLARACRRSNPNRTAAAVSLGLVAGVTALDVSCTAALAPGLRAAILSGDHP